MIERIEHRMSFNGWQDVYKHHSKVLNCGMQFAVFLPPQIETQKCPILYWLSGLTCNEQNFITKGHAQKYASQKGIVIVAPDTSPRGDDVPNDDAYDLGMGAGFYVNATQTPWNKHYKMYDYVVHELPELIEANFQVTSRRAISGHSMGGHGALTIALKNPTRFQSVSAFSPIVAPSQVPWGQKAFSGYLGNDESSWKEYDAVELIKASGGNARHLHLLIDQGLSDEFLENQLKPYLLKDACEQVGHPMTLNLRKGYDHSYYFISTFIGEHFEHHAKALF